MQSNTSQKIEWKSSKRKKRKQPSLSLPYFTLPQATPTKSLLAIYGVVLAKFNGITLVGDPKKVPDSTYAGERHNRPGRGYFSRHVSNNLLLGLG
jgi:hypothetical protein